VTISQQTYRSAREENEKDYDHAMYLIEHGEPDKGLEILKRLKPYLFPETKEVY